MQEARSKISESVSDAIAAHDLTYGEISQILGALVTQWASYQIHDERHPDDPDKSGDIK